jgi:hypothetical protein
MKEALENRFKSWVNNGRQDPVPSVGKTRGLRPGIGTIRDRPRIRAAETSALRYPQSAASPREGWRVPFFSMKSG